MASQKASQREPDEDAVHDDEIQYAHGTMGMEELDKKYGGYNGRPRNHAKTPPFSELLVHLFNPLKDNMKPRTGPKVSRAKNGQGSNNPSPQEQKYNIIQRFISRWRLQVGNDFYPALRLIIPDKDRDRSMYGLKEKAIGKLIVKMLKINPNGDDGQSLLNWKLPGQTTATRMAGDFAGRCYEVLSKRAMRQDYGDMRIAEVNELLDKLSVVSKEEEQLPIFVTFYNRMNADELLWLIRIILREIKIGATEKTLLEVWHPEAEILFSVSSSLRRICWDLWDPEIRLNEDRKGITLMECFQPQLAHFSMHSFQKMIDKLGCTLEDPKFWIEEKLDGERMQLHMRTERGVRKFAFWSRKGKDYTYLYGSSLDDENSALTRFLRDAFDPGVDSIILDGEMITWDPVTRSMVGFGTLKTAAISEQRNPFGETGHRPLLRVFDCLYINGRDITAYVLRDRRKVIDRYIKNVDMRLEIHKYLEAGSAVEIETELRRVIEEASEGLVLKNPRSMYRLNSRNDDWMKVKPEYMTEFGESLDCVVIGGFYGSGHRGGRLSSFLCGLRVDDNAIKAGADPMKCLSFFKVGGGFRSGDYAKIYHQTEGKWHKWDRNNPPKDLIVLGGNAQQQYERPDEWIKPCDSVVLEVKAASVGASEQYGFQYSLRFPRFKKLRDDKTWKEALSTYDFVELKNRVEEENKSKELKVETSRRATKRLKKEIVIAGNDTVINSYAGPRTGAFEGINFCVLSGMDRPVNKSKTEIEQIIKSNGGGIFQNPNTKDNIICIGDKRVVKVASLIKSGTTNIVKPLWVLEALKQVEIDGPQRQRFLIPFEPSHMFHVLDEVRDNVESTVDDYGDSYAKYVSANDLKRIMDDMIRPKKSSFSVTNFLSQLEDHGNSFEVPGSMFRRCVARFLPSEDGQSSIQLQIAKNQFLFGGGTVAESDENGSITHFILLDPTPEQVKSLRGSISERGARIPRIVSLRWLSESWAEKTVLDEEQFEIAA